MQEGMEKDEMGQKIIYSNTGVKVFWERENFIS